MLKNLMKALKNTVNSISQYESTENENSQNDNAVG